jgi:hypothetical protein
MLENHLDNRPIIEYRLSRYSVQFHHRQNRNKKIILSTIIIGASIVSISCNNRQL